MEKFSRKTLADNVSLILSLAWYGLLVMGSILLLIVLSLAVFGEGEAFPSMDIPVKFEEAFVRKIPKINVHGNYMLIAHEGYFKLRIEPGWKNKIWICLITTTLFSGILIVIYQLKNIVRSFRRDNPFDEQNLYRIRIISFMFIGYFIGKNIFIIAMEQYLTKKIVFQNMQLGYNHGTIFLWVGLFLLMLEAVFKRGVILEEEEELTI